MMARIRKCICLAGANCLRFSWKEHIIIIFVLKRQRGLYSIRGDDSPVTAAANGGVGAVADGKEGARERV